MMKLRKLNWFLSELKKIRHVEVLRIGTRLPVVLPMRIDRQVCRMLAKHRPLWMITQFNHPREITPEAEAACRRINEAGIPLCNQTVLLKGVNDSAETMKDLCQGLQRILVKPYYLFQAEPVRGTDHFRVPLSQGRAIIRALWRQTGGLCVPVFVRDTRQGKVLVGI